MAGFVKIDGDRCELTSGGRSAVPNGVSHVTKYNALKQFKNSSGFVLVDSHAVEANGGAGKVSRYVAEVLLAQGFLRFNEKGHLVFSDDTMAETLRTALWTLSNEPCYRVSDTLRAVSDDRVLFHDAHWLELNGYIDAGVAITDHGRRQIPNTLGYDTIMRTLEVFSGSDRWQFQGNYAVGENDGRLSRYVVERLVQMGKLQIDTGGYIVAAEVRQWYKCHLTERELEAIRKCTASTVTLIKPPKTP